MKREEYEEEEEDDLVLCLLPSYLSGGYSTSYYLLTKQKKGIKSNFTGILTESFTVHKIYLIVNNTLLLIVFVLQPKKVSTHDIINVIDPSYNNINIPKMLITLLYNFFMFYLISSCLFRRIYHRLCSIIFELIVTLTITC